MLHKLSVIFTTIVLPLVFAAIALVSWLMGNRGIAMLYIALIPLMFICWGLSHLLAGRKRREIYRHMSDEERGEVNWMAARFGFRMGLFFALPIATVTVLVYVASGQSAIAAAIVFAIGLSVAMPIAYRKARPIRDYCFTTEYGKSHFPDSASQSAKGEAAS